MALKKARAKKSEKKKPASPKKSRTQKSKQATLPHRHSGAHSDNQDFIIVGIGASAGGLKAFHSFLSSAADRADFALVFIQHLSRDHKSRLPELLLSRKPGLDIMEIDNGVHVHPGRLYLCPPGKEVRIRDGVFHTAKSPARHAHLPIDEFFESLAADAGERAIAVVLSGAGTDGARGIQAIRNAGGCVFVQEPGTAEFPGMPQAAIGTGVVDGVLPPEDILPEIIKVLQGDHAVASSDAPLLPEEYDAFYRLIQEKTGHRFTHYKKSVVSRRVRRRMYLGGVRTVAGYLDLIAQKDAEAASLAYDLMIGVTSFFRDRPAWQALEKEVLRKLAAESSNEPVRVWAPATATGEEAYSIAMALLHELARQGNKRDVMIFATDVNDLALERAREGKYAASMAADIPREYVQMYFTTSADGLSIIVKKEVRERVIFAKQDLLTDPPFSRLDLIVCRNLLIYLEPEAQDKCMTIFHYALKPGGCLFLGSAESPGRHLDLFRTIAHKKCRIYVKIATKIAARMQVAVPFAAERAFQAAPAVQPGARPGEQATPLVQDALLEAYAPPAISIDQNYTIVYHNGQTNRFLCQPRGIPTQNVLELLPEELRSRIRSAVYRARQGAKAVAIRALVPGEDKRKRQVTIRVSQVRDGLFLIVFQEQAGRKGAVGQGEDIALDAAGIEETAVHQLETELAATRSDLQHHIEQFRSINEELHSSNEELQAANEELETSREELQSLNEELLTVNAQLQEKIEEQEETNNDLTNFLTSTNIPTVFLDHELKVKRFTPAITTLIKLIPTDVGRPIIDLSQDQLGPDLIADARSVLNTLVPVSKEIRLSDTWYVRAALPYRTADNRIEGVVVTYNDVTALKRAEERTRHLASFPQLNPNPVIEVDVSGKVIFVNPATGRILAALGMEKNDVAVFLPADMDDILRTWNRKDELTLNREVVLGDRTFGETIFLTPQFSVARIYAYDITERKKSEEALRQSEVRYRLLVESVKDYAIFMLDPAGRVTTWNEGAERLKGYKTEEIIGQHFSRFYPAEDEASGKPQRELDAATAEGWLEDEGWRVRKDGSRFWASVLITALRDDSGTLRGFTKVTRDITERKQAQDALQHTIAELREAQRITHIGSWHWDAKTDATTGSDELLRIYGFDPATQAMPNFADQKGQCYPVEDWERVNAAVQRTLQTGDGYELDVRVIRDSALIWVTTRGEIVRDAEGRITGLRGTVQDITERKLAEEALRESQARLEAVFSAIPDVIVEYDAKGALVRANEAAIETAGLSILNFTNRQAIGKLKFRRLDDRALNPDEAPTLRALRGEIVTGEQYAITTADGRDRVVETYAAPLYKEGNVSGVVALWHDITELKRAEEALRESEERYRNLFNTMDEGFCIIEMIFDAGGRPVDYRFLEINAAFEKQTGLHDAKGKLMRELAPAHEAHWFEIYGKIALTGEPLRFVNEARALNRWYDVSAYRVGRPEDRHVAILFNDISAHKRAEEALRESERRERERAEEMAAMFEAVPMPVIIVHDPDSTHMTGNRAADELLRHQRGAEVSLSAPPEVKPRHFKAVKDGRELRLDELPAQRAARGEHMRDFEFSIVFDDGTARHLLGYGTPLLDEQGRPRGAVHVLVDITERKKAEEAQGRLAAIVESAEDAIIGKDLNGIIQTWNVGAETIFGYKAEEVIGKPISLLIPPGHVDEVPEILARIKQGEHIENFETARMRKDGTIIPVSLKFSAIRDVSGRIIGASKIAHDITERKRAQEERETTVAFLRLVNESHDTKELIHAATAFFQELSGCEAVGIRLHEKHDYPYFETRGFSKEFVQLESRLCSCDKEGKPILDETGNPVLACMCGNVICGRFDPSKPFFTKRGSFWSNCTTDLLATTTDADRQTRTSNRCNGEGYESVALIGLSLGEERLGLLQLNDKRKGRFTLATITLWERLADYLAVALAKFRADEALQESEAQYRGLFENMIEGFAYCKAIFEKGKMQDFVYLSVNHVFETLTGLKEVVGKRVTEVIPGIRETDPELFEVYGRVSLTGKPERFEMFVEALKMWFSISVYSPEKESFVAVFDVITERKNAEEALRTSEAKYRTLFENMINGFAYHRIVTDESGRPVDYVFLEANEAFEKLTGLKRADIIGKSVRETLPGIESDPVDWIGTYGNVALTGQEVRFQHHAVPLNKWYSVSAYSPMKGYFVAIFEDVTESKKAEAALRESEERFRSMFERHQAVMLLVEPESGDIVDANAAASRFYGYPPERLRALRIQDINQLTPGEVAAERILAVEERRNYFIFPHRLADGRDRWVEVYSTPIKVQERSLLFSVIHDITERKRAEEALQRSSRALKAISNSREAVIRAEDESSFMNDVCTIVVEDCGFSMVWIGFAEDDEAKSVRPVAHAGFEEGYLETLRITWADTERGRGPTGTAIRTGEVAVCRNMLTDPAFTPWREEALRRGYASSIVFPLWADDKVFGAFTIYSKEADPFSKQEVKLLTEVADDLAYGIMTLRMGTARKAAETALRDSEAQLRTIFEQAAVGIVYTGLDGRFVRFNQRLEEITGYPREELQQLTFQSITHPDDLEADLIQVRRMLNGEISSFTMDKRYIRKDGSPVWINLAGSLVRDMDGKPGYFIAIIEDIEARKRAEEQIRQQVEELTRLNRAMVGRELRMIELKKEVNGLLGLTGQPLRYPLDFEKEQS